jgi:hypothetical protein
MMVNIPMIMAVLRCVSRSIVLDSELRSLSRCTLTAGRKQNPQKVESTPRHMITKQRRRKYSLIMGVLFAIHQKPNKTEAEQMRTFCAIASAFPQRHDSRSRSPHKTQAADNLLFFAAFNRKRAAILKPSLFQKHFIKLHNTAHNILCNILLSIFQFVLAFLVIMWYTLIKIKERHNDSEA